MATVDVKDFYLSGSPSEVASDVSSLMDAPLAALVKETIYSLLDNQLIFSMFLQCFYRCYNGTGMGLKHSGHCANLAFYAAVEKAFVHRLTAHGITSYIRYHDDIFVVFESRQAMLNFLTPLVRNSGYFTILCSCISQTSLEFLDLTVTTCDGHLKVQPTLNKIPSPLCPTSCHHASIHKSWPPAVASRVCSLAHDKAGALSKLLAAYALANAAPVTLQMLRPRPARERLQSQVPIVTCVLRYHPVFVFALGRAMSEAPLPSSFNFCIQPSWTNALPSTASVITKSNLRNARRRMYNDQGIPFLVESEVGGNIVVVSLPVSSTITSANPITDVTKFTIENLHLAWLRT